MICGHRHYKEISKFDTTFLYSCNKCGVIFTNKYLIKFNPKDIYETYYKNEMASRFGFGIERVIRLFRFFRAFKIFTLYPHAKSILDVGSGRGFMLYYLKRYYKYRRAAGTQISKNAIEFSINDLGLEIYDKDLLELSMGPSFDIITIWHVLEHVVEPEKYIEKIFNLLKDNGKLIIEVPNFNSWTRALTKRYWLSLDLNYHITFFTPESLSLLLKNHGFKIKTIHTYSLEYSAFTSAQSLISLITRTDCLFFQYLQTSEFNKQLVLHIFL
ncbi:MAG: hypothetical protein COW10_04815, partial [Candidatus Omnitrophica bacterium CG12_big_fil_rev_8_21_14_0_65_42_8]